MRKATILIADDHRVVIEGISSALREYSEFEIVGRALHGREAVRLVKQLMPDIVVMDISMPDLNGVDAALQIKKYNPNIAIIIFSMFSNKEYVVDLFKAGVSAYVLKEDPMSELILALKAARGGGTYFSTMVQNVLLHHMKALETGKKYTKDPFEELSLREREVFQLLVEGKSLKETAKKLDVSPKTVETHKYNIMEKLNVRTLSDLTKIAIKKRIIQL
jgi:DNA-binding NarL/FixJ family response regulator